MPHTSMDKVPPKTFKFEFLLLLKSLSPQSLWQGLYIRGGLESAVSLPGLEAKRRLREKNRELQEKLVDVRAQLSSLQATVRAHLNS